MSKVLWLHSHAFKVNKEFRQYDFIFRKIASDRFDERYEVLKNRWDGKINHIMTVTEIEGWLKDKT